MVKSTIKDCAWFKSKPTDKSITHNRMKIIILFALLVCASCDQRPVLTPPFMVVQIHSPNAYCGKGHTKYTFQDVNGAHADFCEVSGKYSIGDTLGN